MQRSHGRARVALGRAGISDLHQQGSAKVFSTAGRDTPAEIVFLNTSGGLAGGDTLSLAVDLAERHGACATTQTAERAYRSDAGVAVVSVALSAAAGARLDWLPQETIIFQRAALDRVTTVDLAGDAEFLGVETIVLGRAAMGEVVTRLHLHDRREIRRDGRLVLVDILRLDDAALAGGAALLGGARVVSTLILAAPDAEAALAPVREALGQLPVDGAASARPGALVVRLRGADSWQMRGAIARLVLTLRPGRLPRVWQQ